MLTRKLRKLISRAEGGAQTVDASTVAQNAAPRERRAFRERRLKFAVATSLISKVASALVQLVAVPIAVRSLGVERFGIFMMLISIFGWIDLGTFGLGPGLTRNVAIAWNSGDKPGEQRNFASALYLLLSIGGALAIVIVVALAILSFFPGWLPLVFGRTGPPNANDIHTAILCITAIFLAQLVLTAVERVRSAYQEDYITNVATAAGNAGCFAAMILVANLWPTIAGFVVATYATLVVGKIVNGILLVMRDRPYLVPRTSAADWATIGDLVRNGIPFGIIQLGTILNSSLAITVFGLIAGMAALAPFAASYRILWLLLSGVTMITQPLWPALVDARVRGDHAWVVKCYKRLILSVLAYSVTACLGLFLLGKPIINLWLGTPLIKDRAMLGFLGLYFILWTWNHAHTIIFIGIGWLREAAGFVFTEGLVAIIVGGFLASYYGGAGMAAGFCIASLTVTAWGAPTLLVRRGLTG